jgi:hypothetical protein
VKKKITVAYLFISLFFLMVLTSLSHAGSAEVLPKGVFRTNVTYSYYLPIDKRFDPDGDVEDIATDFNATLNSSVFPALSLVEAGFSLPSGSANLGNSIVSFEYEFHDLIFSLQYGLTDRLTIGVKVPYYWNRNSIDSSLDTSGATVGKSAILASLAPIGFLDTVPLTKQDILDILGEGLDIDGDGTIDIPGFGFEKFGTWDDSGLADIEAGFRYQYYKSENWRLAFTGGLRIPTGEVDDPDNLVDIAFGDGAPALLFQFQNDYTGIENFVLNATLRYDLVLPDEETRRVPGDVNQPITTNRERVDRDLGDIFELEASADYEFSEGLNFSLLYRFGLQIKDEVDGDLGFAYESLEDETDWTAHAFIVGISYSTIPQFQEEKFPIPLNLSIEYENVFAGKNNYLKQQLFSFGFAVYF